MGTFPVGALRQLFFLTRGVELQGARDEITHDRREIIAADIHDLMGAGQKRGRKLGVILFGALRRCGPLARHLLQDMPHADGHLVRIDDLDRFGPDTKQRFMSYTDAQKLAALFGHQQPMRKERIHEFTAR